MIIFSDYRKLNQIIQHVSQSLSCKEASANQWMFGGIPERIIFLLKLGNNTCFEILLRHVLDNVIPVWKFINIPPVTIADLSVNYFYFNGVFFHIDFSIFSFWVHQHHFNTHWNVSLELFRIGSITDHGIRFTCTCLTISKKRTMITLPSIG